MAKARQADGETLEAKREPQALFQHGGNVDADHHVFEFYESDGGPERKTTEIYYARRK